MYAHVGFDYALATPSLHDIVPLIMLMYIQFFCIYTYMYNEHTHTHTHTHTMYGQSD